MDLFKNKVVSYFYDEEIGNFCYGGGNPMRPHRVRLTHTLVEGYGLADRLKIKRPEPQDEDQIAMFHADEYVDFLNSVTPDNQEEYLTQLRRFNLGPAGEADCPVFDGLFEYCQIYSGGSVDGAASLAAGEGDICLNWSGGMHHAKKAEASGFCYINDIVLACLELLKTYQRVLYVDIDIHHGDGVEEAFYLTDRVMTVSFHKYGDFFPGTGAVGDIGYGTGKGYSLNVPLQEGMDDESYRTMFEPIMQKVMEKFQPGAVVVCAGADSLSGDRLGCFNLSLEGHSNCIEFLGRFNVPLLVLGGGGYTLRNVSRCWAYETGRIMGVDLPDKLPEDTLSQFDYYMDTHNLRIATSNMKNGNSKEQMQKIKEQCLRNLAEMTAAPSAQFTVHPPVFKRAPLPEEDPDVRGGGQAHDDARVNKFEHDAEDSLAEEGSNKHRGGRDDAEAPAAQPAPAQKAEGVKKEKDGGASMEIDKPKAGNNGPPVIAKVPPVVRREPPPTAPPVRVATEAKPPVKVQHTTLAAPAAATKPKLEHTPAPRQSAPVPPKPQAPVAKPPSQAAELHRLGGDRQGDAKASEASVRADFRPQDTPTAPRSVPAESKPAPSPVQKTAPEREPAAAPRAMPAAASPAGDALSHPEADADSAAASGESKEAKFIHRPKIKFTTKLATPSKSPGTDSAAPGPPPSSGI